MLSTFRALMGRFTWSMDTQPNGLLHGGSNVVGLEAMSLILAINVILLSVFLWRKLFKLARERYRLEGAITL